MIDWLRNKLPAPMAAPETLSCAVPGAASLPVQASLQPSRCSGRLSRALLGACAPALFIGLAVFLAIQGAFWLSAKNVADDAWLLSGDWRDE